jgi:hypothetical protein
MNDKNSNVPIILSGMIQRDERITNNTVSFHIKCFTNCIFERKTKEMSIIVRENISLCKSHVVLKTDIWKRTKIIRNIL